VRVHGEVERREDRASTRSRQSVLAGIAAGENDQRFEAIGDPMRHDRCKQIATARDIQGASSAPSMLFSMIPVQP
jgi:hypothetical protein